jgi:hypothetical protein
MSIKHFHQVIILASFLICLVFSYWCFTDPTADGVVYEVAGVGSLLVAAGLVYYEILFLKKTKKILIY